MKKKLTTTLMMLAAATALTACGNDSEFTDEEIAALERVDEMFTHDEDTRQVEEPLYHDRALPVMQTSENATIVDLDTAMEICEHLRGGMEYDEVVDEMEPEDPEAFHMSVHIAMLEMCEL